MEEHTRCAMIHPRPSTRFTTSTPQFLVVMGCWIRTSQPDGIITLSLFIAFQILHLHFNTYVMPSIHHCLERGYDDVNRLDFKELLRDFGKEDKAQARNARNKGKMVQKHVCATSAPPCRKRKVPKMRSLKYIYIYIMPINREPNA